jgi:hypothetical protein
MVPVASCCRAYSTSIVMSIVSILVLPVASLPQELQQSVKQMVLL